MKKIIAIMAAVLMLCSVIPMGAISVSAATVVYSQDFEGGLGTWVGSSSSPVELVAAADLPVANPNGGNYAMKQVLNGYHYMSDHTTFAVESNTDYMVSVDVLHTTNNWPVEVNIGKDYWLGSCAFKSGTVKVSNTQWTTLSFIFNSGDSTVLYAGVKSSYENCTIYVDNYSIVKVEAADFGTTDGYIYNGNFETASSPAWSTSANASIVADPTGAGQGNVMQTNENTSSVTMFSQIANNLKANTYYKLSFKVYGYTTAVSNAAFWVQFPKTITDWSVDLGDSGMTSQSANDYTPRINVSSKLNAWYDLSITFNTGDLTSALINFMNYRANGGQYYFDDIKLTEMKTPTDDGYIVNGDFETGDLTGWTKTSATVVADGDGYILQGTNTAKYGNFVHQIVDVEANTNYAISFKAKGAAEGGQARLYAGTGTGNAGAVNSTYYFSVKTDAWTNCTVSFNSGENTELYINLCQGITDGGDIYYDDVVMWQVKDASFDGYITNGDFETGAPSGWKFSQSTAGVAREAAYTGTFGANLQGKGSWGGLMSQSFTTEAGATYKITFWYKAISRGVNWTVKDTDNNGTSLTSGYVSTTSWTKVEKEFTALSDTTYLNFNGPGTEANGAEQVYVDDLSITLIAPAHVCEIVELERVEAGCETEGYVKYGCQCGEGVYTEPIYPQGHTYDVIDHKDATCGAAGYNTLSCVDCGDSYDVAIEATGEHSYTYDCDKNCAACGNETRPEAEHEYFNDCETICMICYEETREASHNVLHVEAVAATCAAGGNIEYWYCDVCGAAWLDADCIQNTNLRAVKTAATGEHTYDNDFDVDCNECGAVREVVFPVPAIGKSISEDVSGYAVLFDANVENLVNVDGAADYANATYNGYKLLGLGVTASNGKSSATIEGVRVYGINDDNGNLQFAFRIVNIPESGYETEITMVPYYTVEIDGEIVTIEGEAVIGSYAEIAG